VDAQREFPALATLLERLASLSRLILFDKRGSGPSDPVAIDGLPTLDEGMDDLRGDRLADPRLPIHAPRP
jgi:hypothetical protein